MTRRLRLGVDATLIRKNGKGVSRFLQAFLHTFAEEDIGGIELSVFVDQQADLPELVSHRAVRYVPVRIPKQLQWDFLGFNRALKAEKADIALTLSDRVWVSTPYVNYIFEIPDYRIAANKASASRYQQIADVVTSVTFPMTLRKAAHVAVSSKATRSDLMRRYGVKPEKLTVVYPAPAPAYVPDGDSAARKATQARHDAPDGYLFHVSSNNDPRDNTGVVLRGFAQSRARTGHRKKLVIAGVQRLTKFGWDRVMDEHGIRDEVRFAGFVSNPAEMAGLYRGAEAYIDASLYEGFGFQVSEALACGTPVICSNNTSLPEVAGSAALLIDSWDEQGLADAICAVVSNGSVAMAMAENALKEAAKFSWRRTTTELIDLALRFRSNRPSR